jgi:hypothetical protein
MKPFRSKNRSGHPAILAAGAVFVVALLAAGVITARSVSRNGRETVSDSSAGEVL